MKHIGAAALFLFLCYGTAWAQAQIVAQVVDGEVWQTTMVLTNGTAAAAHASLSFFQDTTNSGTQPWNLTFLEVASTSSVPLAAGETLLLHTPGIAPSLTQGWALVTADPGVVVYAIFTKRPQGLAAQVGTSPAIASATRILVPFDNTSGNVAAMAIVNPGATPETVNVNIRTTAGTVTQATLPTIPGLGHAAFTFPQQLQASVGTSGLAEFYATSGTFSILSLSFNPAGSLTTAPVYNQSGPPILAGTGTAGSVTFAGFAVGKVTSGAGFPPSTPELTEMVSGEFGVYSAAEWALPYSAPTVDVCSVFSRSYAVGAHDPSSPDSGLDAGTSIAVSGPNLLPGASMTKFVTALGPIYQLLPTAGTLALGGTYTLTGSGGTQVSPFTVSATLPNSLMVTNWDSITAINRATPLTINWTGSGFDLLLITITGVATSGSTTTDVSITCPLAASLGSYTVPAAALASLPVTSTGFLSVTGTVNGGGSVNAISGTSQSFTPGLVGGGSINYGQFRPYLATNKSLAIQ